uniref:Transmembrane protein 254 n=1 Tax=Rousettus aegyptiacus TaxID=9407 RepID=A0A7J8GH34_ROUAE|nr:transmembrane protein 254 [Rousettus aegyptiacus]
MVGCLLASEYSLSEPRTPGLLHSVLGGPSSHRTTQWADFCFRYWLAWLIHVGEALYSMVLCRSKGITNGRAQLLWFLQTLLLGIASLSILIAYRPKHRKQT